MILADTSVWVKALRREPSAEKRELEMLLNMDSLATTDMVVAEVLQGARSQDDFDRLARRLEGPHYFHTDRAAWQEAGRLSFELKMKGQTTALSDLLIAAVALANDLEVYATDTDFERVPGLRRYQATYT
jgi:predicted nucleic acid-binding protein